MSYIHHIIRNISAENENTVLAHLIDFGWFDLSDIAYSVRWNRYSNTDSDQVARKGH